MAIEAWFMRLSGEEHGHPPLRIRQSTWEHAKSRFAKSVAWSVEGLATHQVFCIFIIAKWASQFKMWHRDLVLSIYICFLYEKLEVTCPFTMTNVSAKDNSKYELAKDFSFCRLYRSKSTWSEGQEEQEQKSESCFSHRKSSSSIHRLA